MKKAVLISIKPKWCRMILDLVKRYEIRKNRPSGIDLPFTCYIYCTQKKRESDILEVTENHFGKEVRQKLNGKIIARFTCDRIEEIPPDELTEEDLKDTGVTIFQAQDYADGETLYKWHIRSLITYQPPLSLNQFVCKKRLSTPPMSWCFVDEKYLPPSKIPDQDIPFAEPDYIGGGSP